MAGPTASRRALSRRRPSTFRAQPPRLHHLGGMLRSDRRGHHDAEREVGSLSVRQSSNWMKRRRAVVSSVPIPALSRVASRSLEVRTVNVLVTRRQRSRDVGGDGDDVLLHAPVVGGKATSGGRGTPKSDRAASRAKLGRQVSDVLKVVTDPRDRLYVPQTQAQRH